jgi:class 3 adenylate cyclase
MAQMDTIGDAYVAAVLLPPGSSASAEAAACCRVLTVARGMIDAVVACRKGTGRTGLACRIGVSVGGVLAGVLGQLQPRFHIFGSGIRTAELHEQVNVVDFGKKSMNNCLVK